LHEKSQEVARELVQEMLDALDIQLTKRSNENFIKDILGSVMRGVSMAELVEELIRNLPIEPDDDQRGIIETTAEQLYVIPEGPEAELYYSTKEIMEDIVDEVLLIKGEPNSVIARMISKLVEQLPIDFLKQKTSIEFMVSKIIESHLEIRLNRSDIMHMLHTQEAKNILDEIIQTVFDTGVDLLYYIKDN
jgi:hypothetical protein